MKKFLVFLVAIIVTVCVGLTTYYFLRNDERITLGTKEIYCNVGDVISLEDLEISVFKKNKKTKYNYNAGGEEVTQMVEFDDAKQYYVTKKGGTATVVISTTNKKYSKLELIVHIGDGQEASPYYLSSEADLKKIGNIYASNAHYTMRNNVTLSGNFQPIGAKENGVNFEAFSGSFNGNGYSISGLKLDKATYTQAGLFYELSNAKVTDLKINNVTIVGAYDYVGALSGKATGTISRVFANNVSITNTKDGGVVGGLVGELNGAGSTLNMSAVKNLSLNILSDTAITTVVGGLVGKSIEANISSTYATGKFDIDNSINAIAGGLVGELSIGPATGNIQHSYSSINSDYTNLGAFISKISTMSGFDKEKANSRRYLIGNYVASNGKSAIKVDESTIFTVLNDEEKHLYLIKEFTNEDALKANGTYIFFAVGKNDSDTVLWDNSIWTISVGKLPELKLVETADVMVTMEYLTRDLEDVTVGDPSDTNTENVQTFIETFGKANNGVKYTLKTDVDLTGIDWTPYALTNSVIDGQGHTIKGLNLKNTKDGYLGLFSIIENSSIKNLIIEGANVSGEATNAGILAGEIKSTDTVVATSIENITIKGATVNAKVTNFGAISAISNRGIIKGCTVESLAVAETVRVDKVAGFVAIANGGKLENNTITTSTIIGYSKVAGIVAENSATITGVVGDVILKSHKEAMSTNIGGVVAENATDISNVELNIDIILGKIINANNIGGIAGVNNGVINKVKLTGKGINLAEAIGSQSCIGGVAGLNYGKISNSYCYLDNIGGIFANQTTYVGGIVASNAGNIYTSIAGSNLQGNYVGGVVAVMNNPSAVVDQVLVGKYVDGAVQQITIKGDVYVGNVAYDVAGGTMTNIECCSELVGANNSTRTSLVVILLQDKAVVRNVAVDSVLNGYGTFYLETFSDLGAHTNVTNGTRPNNIYEEKGHNTGIMESVVVNGEKAMSNGLIYKAASVIADVFGSTYNSSDNKNFVKTVMNVQFESATTFKGSYTVSAKWAFIEHKWSRDLTFDFAGQVWTENAGVRLGFLSKI